MNAPFRSKVIIRNLPATISNKQFHDFMEPWINYIDYASFHPGKVSNILLMKPVRPAKAFINFKDPDVLLDFVKQCIEKPYLDENGKEYLFSVEFAPYQVVPNSTTTANNINDLDINQKVPSLENNNVLEADEEFKAFLASLETSEEPRSSATLEEQLEKMIVQEREQNPWKYSKDKAQSTPLLDYMMNDPKFTTSYNNGTTTTKKADKSAQKAKKAEKAKARKKEKKAKKQLKKKVVASEAETTMIRPAKIEKRPSSNPPMTLDHANNQSTLNKQQQPQQQPQQSQQQQQQQSKGPVVYKTEKRTKKAANAPKSTPVNAQSTTKSQPSKTVPLKILKKPSTNEPAILKEKVNTSIPLETNDATKKNVMPENASAVTYSTKNTTKNVYRRDSKSPPLDNPFTSIPTLVTQTSQLPINDKIIVQDASKSPIKTIKYQTKAGTTRPSTSKQQPPKTK